MKRYVLLFGITLMGFGNLLAREFTVLVYNVENLFDLDGVALYSDYEQHPSGPYGTEQLLNKVANIRRTLAAVNDGHGPEVIMFQEFELDRTPFGTPSAEAFLEMANGRTLEELLKEESWTANLPVELLLLKDLEDNGLNGYRIAQADPFKMENHTPHKNVVFSRFPVNFVRQRAMRQARDLVVVGLDIDGHELILLNNHWKSGASNPDTEAVRVQNALVVRAELESILLGNPQADVLIAGDLNCYYNQKAVFSDRFDEAAVNDVLPTHGYESRMVGAEADGLYNLWYELPSEKRGSEVYRGYWGTLMQILIAPGLYDQSGIQYIDNSFNRLILPGKNVETRWGRPIRWSNHGGGAGFSDHLPVYARFRVAPEGNDGGWLSLDNPTDEDMGKDRPKINFARMDRRAVPEAKSLAALCAVDQASQIGQLFTISQPLSAEQPARIMVGDLEMQIYSPDRKIRNRLDAMKEGDLLKAHADLDSYRGQLQFVIQDPSWIKVP